MYKDGKFVEKFKDARTMANLITFLRRHAEEYYGQNFFHEPVPTEFQEVFKAKELLPVPVVSTESPGLREPLTPENFNSTIKNGLWFVEHTSPHCWHCRNFAPTWEKLANSEDDHKGVEMAQIDCAMNGGA